MDASYLNVVLRDMGELRYVLHLWREERHAHRDSFGEHSPLAFVAHRRGRDAVWCQKVGLDCVDPLKEQKRAACSLLPALLLFPVRVVTLWRVLKRSDSGDGKAAQ